MKIFVRSLAFLMLCLSAFLSVNASAQTPINGAEGCTPTKPGNQDGKVRVEEGVLRNVSSTTISISCILVRDFNADEIDLLVVALNYGSVQRSVKCKLHQVTLDQALAGTVIRSVPVPASSGAELEFFGVETSPQQFHRFTLECKLPGGTAISLIALHNFFPPPLI